MLSFGTCVELQLPWYIMLIRLHEDQVEFTGCTRAASLLYWLGTIRCAPCLHPLFPIEGTEQSLTHMHNITRCTRLQSSIVQ